MVQKKQTARKTTGSYLHVSVLTSKTKSKPRAQPKRRTTTTRTTISRSKAPPTTLTCPGDIVGVPKMVIERPPPLNVPISAYTRFATWLETQTCVHDDKLLCAVERDGDHLLSLAKATITFDNALRRRDPPPATPNDTSSSGLLRSHARTLRAFATVLKLKVSEGSLGQDLEEAVLRDGEPLLQLALCCLEFDRAIQPPSVPHTDSFAGQTQSDATLSSAKDTKIAQQREDVTDLFRDMRTPTPPHHLCVTR